MSKSGNVSIRRCFSAVWCRRARLYECSWAPLIGEVVSQDGVVGVYGFLRRVWRMVVDWEADDDRCSPAVPRSNDRRAESVLHKTILA